MIEKTYRLRDETYLKVLRLMPCIYCGQLEAGQVHHIRRGTDGGMGRKPSDQYAVPLCPKCHTLGSHAVHRRPEDDFFEECLKVNPVDFAVRLYEIYLKGGNMQKFIRSRQKDNLFYRSMKQYADEVNLGIAWELK